MGASAQLKKTWSPIELHLFSQVLFFFFFFFLAQMAILITNLYTESRFKVPGFEELRAGLVLHFPSLASDYPAYLS